MATTADIRAIQPLVPANDIVAVRDSSDVTLVARTAFDAPNDINAYPTVVPVVAASGGTVSNAQLAVTLGDVVGAAQATVLVQAAESTTLGDTTVAAQATVAVQAVEATTLGDATVAAQGTVLVQAVETTTLGDTTVAAQGAVAVQGALSRTLADATLVATTGVAVAGVVAETLQSVGLVAGGLVEVQGVVASTLADATLVAAGTIGSNAVHGVVDIVLGGATAAGAAFVSRLVPEYTGGGGGAALGVASPTLGVRDVVLSGIVRRVEAPAKSRYAEAEATSRKKAA